VDVLVLGLFLAIPIPNGRTQHIVRYTNAQQRLSLPRTVRVTSTNNMGKNERKIARLMTNGNQPIVRDCIV
jgi:hypothetical protein